MFAIKKNKYVPILLDYYCFLSQIHTLLLLCEINTLLLFYCRVFSCLWYNLFKEHEIATSTIRFIINDCIDKVTVRCGLADQRA